MIRVHIECTNRRATAALAWRLAAIPEIELVEDDGPADIVITGLGQAVRPTTVAVFLHSEDNDGFDRAVEAVRSLMGKAHDKLSSPVHITPHRPSPAASITIPNLLAPEHRRKGLITLAVVAVAASLVATSLAAFNATTINPSTFSSGTVILTDQKNAATICYSAGVSSGTFSTNSNGACDDLIAATIALPGTATSNTVTLKYTGSVPLGSIATYTLASSSCVAANNATDTFHGNDTGTNTGFCSHVDITISDTTNGACIYPAHAGACVAGDLSSTNTMSGLAAATLTVTKTATLATSGIVYTIATKLDTGTAINTDQGLTASQSYTWQVST